MAKRVNAAGVIQEDKDSQAVQGMAKTMKYLGIDPGFARCGWGVIDDRGNGLQLVEYGVIETPASLPFPFRLRTIKEMIIRIAGQFSIDALAVEHPIHGGNVTNSVEVGAAYGAVLLASTEMSPLLFIYWPSQVKAAVLKGNASKKEVQQAVKLILGLSKVPRPDDAADAVAVAVCLATRYQIDKLQKEEALWFT